MTITREIEFPCCGETHVVRNTMELTQRVERRCGPIHPLAQRLLACHVTQAEIVALIVALLEGEHDAPPKTEIAAWVYRTGTAPAGIPLADAIMPLVMGDELLARYADVSGRTSEPQHRPFATTAA